MTDLSPLHRLAQPHPVRAPRGSQLHCANWLIEAAWRMIQNNLDPEVAENPDALVVYGASARRRATGTAMKPSSSRCESCGPMRRCWCRAASRWVCSAPTPTRRAC